MTADIAFQANDFENNSLLSRLTLTIAGFTIFLALLSLILSNRQDTLRDEYQDAIQKNFATETDAELKSVAADISATKQSLETEKAMTDKLRKKIAAITQESEKIKVDLVLAQKTIEELRSAETSVETTDSLPFSNPPIFDGSPEEASSDPDMESKGLLTAPEVQLPVSSPPIQESIDSSLPDEPVAPSTSESEPPAPSVVPLDNETASESIQTQ